MISSVVVLQGCNLCCPFCHSHNLIPRTMPSETVPLDRIVAFLERRRGWVDGVVVSGGEPTVHPELPEFLAAFKSLGLAVKLDTNGTAPGMLSDLMDMGLVDCVAMDLKAPLEEARYAEACGGFVELAAVQRSIALLLSGRVNSEFRTTVCPRFVRLEDLPGMARSIAGARTYVLQQFIPETALDSSLRTVAPHPKARLTAVARELTGIVERCFVRGENPAPAPLPATADATAVSPN
jgi:pyruvate formate lyase activating enzyme